MSRLINTIHLLEYLLQYPYLHKDTYISCRGGALTVALESTDIGIAEILIKAHPYHIVEPNGDVVITLT